MTDELRKKIEQALATPNVPLLLTSTEAAEMEAYVALVGYFETHEGVISEGNA